MSKIYSQYLELKQKDSSKLYLFRCGNFYIFIADDCDKINEYVVLKKVPFTKEAYKCGFPLNSLNDYLRVFSNHNLNIEVIEEIMDKESKDIKEILKKLDINKMTPIDALLKLKELKEYVG